jgi:hypothetical protein
LLGEGSGDFPVLAESSFNITRIGSVQVLLVSEYTSSVSDFVSSWSYTAFIIR